MKFLKNIKHAGLLAVTACIILSACNKAPLAPVPLGQAAQSSAPTIAKLLDDPEFSFLKAAATRAGLLPMLSAPNLRFTVFAPNDNAFMVSGIPSAAVIGVLPVATLNGLLSYHIIPQTIPSSSIPTTFPNFEYPTILNPTGVPGTPGYNALARLTTFPSRRGAAAWVNNIPVTAVDIAASNGVVHKVAALVAPPVTKYLWDTISTSADLTYLKAAIQRADSGLAVGSRLQTALSSFGTNLTILAPTDAAVKGFLTFSISQALTPLITQQLIPVITAQLIAGGASQSIAATQAPILAAQQAPTIALQQATALSASPTVFSNPLLFAALPAQTVRGLLVYHILGTTIPGIRVWSVNLPTTGTLQKTLLNQVFKDHPGVTLQGTFTGPFVTAATVKGFKNPTASNFIAPFDINLLNGIMHKIDQVLVPQ